MYVIIGFVGALLFSVSSLPLCSACFISGPHCLHAGMNAQVHLIYDLQLMMAGKKYQVSPDEYISSALSIFLDIVNIFLMILTILGGSGFNS